MESQDSNKALMPEVQNKMRKEKKKNISKKLKVNKSKVEKKESNKVASNEQSKNAPKSGQDKPLLKMLENGKNNSSKVIKIIQDVVSKMNDCVQVLKKVNDPIKFKAKIYIASKDVCFTSLVRYVSGKFYIHFLFQEVDLTLFTKEQCGVFLECSIEEAVSKIEGFLKETKSNKELNPEVKNVFKNISWLDLLQLCSGYPNSCVLVEQDYMEFERFAYVGPEKDIKKEYHSKLGKYISFLKQIDGFMINKSKSENEKTKKTENNEKTMKESKDSAKSVKISRKQKKLVTEKDDILINIDAKPGDFVNILGRRRKVRTDDKNGKYANVMKKPVKWDILLKMQIQYLKDRKAKALAKSKSS